jgi:uncharacterized protein (TIGR02996 family)
MIDEAAFLRAIQANPEDDAPRLIYADWLDEQGESDRAEFIRLQIALEPLRRSRTDPADELERVRRLNRIPPGEERSRDDWPLAQQLERERQLLEAYRADWLGEAAGVEAARTNYFEPDFRRGFVSSAGIGLTALAAHGEEVRRGCPMLRRLVVFGTLGGGEQLASCTALAELPELLLAGWLNPSDADTLVRSPHLKSLHSLTFRIGAEGDEEVCRTLAGLRGLRELTLVQMWGGIASADPEGLDRRANLLIGQTRRPRRRLSVRLERPFDRWFPLDGVHVGYGIDAGHLPGRQAVLVYESKQPVLMHFNTAGYLVREEQLDLRQKLFKPDPYYPEECNAEELIEVLGREIGFTPGPIFVREFRSELTEVGVQRWGLHRAELATPGTTNPEWASPEDIGRSLYWWWSTDQFRLPFGNDYWADGLGQIHSS